MPTGDLFWETYRLPIFLTAHERLVVRDQRVRRWPEGDTCLFVSDREPLAPSVPSRQDAVEQWIVQDDIVHMRPSGHMDFAQPSDSKIHRDRRSSAVDNTFPADRSIPHQLRRAVHGQGTIASNHSTRWSSTPSHRPGSSCSCRNRSICTFEERCDSPRVGETGLRDSKVSKRKTILHPVRKSVFREERETGRRHQRHSRCPAKESPCPAAENRRDDERHRNAVGTRPSSYHASAAAASCHPRFQIWSGGSGSGTTQPNSSSSQGFGLTATAGPASPLMVFGFPVAHW